MKRLAPILLFFICIQLANAQAEQIKVNEKVFGKYKITILNSPRGDVKAVLKIEKGETGKISAEFIQDGEAMKAEKVEIVKNKISIERYSLEAMGMEEWELKVDNNKISGTVNYDYRVTGYRMNQ